MLPAARPGSRPAKRRTPELVATPGPADGGISASAAAAVSLRVRRDIGELPGVWTCPCLCGLRRFYYDDADSHVPGTFAVVGGAAERRSLDRFPGHPKPYYPPMGMVPRGNDMASRAACLARFSACGKTVTHDKDHVLHNTAGRILLFLGKPLLLQRLPCAARLGALH
jgi:hypothetical protein